MSCEHRQDCTCSLTAAPYQQSLEELDFDRSLCGAAQRNDIGRLAYLVEVRKVSPDSPAVAGADGILVGHTPLIVAARAGHLEACRLLIDVSDGTLVCHVGSQLERSMSPLNGGACKL